jgi:hypothetical protein
VTRLFYDTEFLEDGRSIDLISIGMVAEDGREFYAVNRQLPVRRIRKHPWLMANVVPSLPKPHGQWIFDMPKSWLFNYSDACVKPRRQIAAEVRDFILATPEPCELWADFGAYDHVVLAQLFGPMTGFPDGIPMWTHDLRQFAEQCGNPALPTLVGEAQHNALHDAREVAMRHDWLLERIGTGRGECA